MYQALKGFTKVNQTITKHDSRVLYPILQLTKEGPEESLAQDQPAYNKHAGQP